MKTNINLNHRRKCRAINIEENIKHIALELTTDEALNFTLNK